MKFVKYCKSSSICSDLSSIMPEVNQKEESFRRSSHRQLFKMMIIPLCAVVILICLKDMSLSYVFAQKVVESQAQNISKMSEQSFRNHSQIMAEAIANINAMWVGLHAVGLYAAVVEDPYILWFFSMVELLMDILVVIYWTSGFYPLVMPDMAILTLYFFLITVFSWVFTLSVI